MGDILFSHASVCVSICYILVLVGESRGGVGGGGIKTFVPFQIKNGIVTYATRISVQSDQYLNCSLWSDIAICNS